jgi:hypothetical protein
MGMTKTRGRLIALRQFGELFTHILHGLSPDAEVRKWSTEPAHYHNGRRPTRRAWLLYICREFLPANLSQSLWKLAFGSVLLSPDYRFDFKKHRT